MQSMQVMITKSMRKTLTNSLHYTDEEVNDMEPQIAAVVVSKLAHFCNKMRRLAAPEEQRWHVGISKSSVACCLRLAVAGSAMWQTFQVGKHLLEPATSSDSP